MNLSLSRRMLMNGTGGSGAVDTPEDACSVLLRLSLLQQQRALTQNLSLANALSAAAEGEERVCRLLQQQQQQLQQSAAAAAAAAEKSRTAMQAELAAAWSKVQQLQQQLEEIKQQTAKEISQAQQNAAAANAAAEQAQAVCLSVFVFIYLLFFFVCLDKK